MTQKNIGHGTYNGVAASELTAIQPRQRDIREMPCTTVPDVQLYFRQQAQKRRRACPSSVTISKTHLTCYL